MDANGLRFWLLADEADWHRAGHLQYDRARRSLRLASERTPPSWTPDRTAALARLEEVRTARDAFDTYARWDGAQKAVVAGGAVPGEVAVALTPGRQAPTDLCQGADGVLYLAGPFGVTLHDRRNERASRTVTAPGFTPWRLAARPDAGVWVLDRAGRALGRVRGSLSPDRPFEETAPDTFRPEDENPDSPRLSVLPSAALPAGEAPVALACSPAGRLAVLAWAADGGGVLRVLRDDLTWGDAVRLAGARYPYSLAWVSEERVAVMVPGAAEAPAYPADGSGGAEALPVGDLHPLRDHTGGPFAHGPAFPPRYPVPGGHRPLHRLSLPSFAPAGEAMNLRLLDSGSTRTVWHRLYLEAHLPPGCGVVLRLAASDDPAAPMDPAAWHPHLFGSAFPAGSRPGEPRGAWVPHPSELPFHPGLLDGAPEPGRCGLFTALVQRAGRAVRSLRGRYLWVRAELVGSGVHSPEVAAVRAYGGRFSYVENYLPELYRETVFGPDADLPAPRSTPADFLERFLGIFEGVLTPLEDRIAGAHLLTDPAAAPDEALDWLASWIGFAAHPALPPERRRAMLRAAPALAERHGTLAGLALALDVATGGGVRGGEVVVLEEFRLRRTFATILGADLARAEDDPLTGGLSVSGNSYVGDTLLLGDERRREFLALFADALPRTAAEDAAVDDLFERLAHRVTVLVHQEVDPQDLGLIRRVVAAEAPAHVRSRVLAATRPFLVGMASLVGVDSYLGPPAETSPVRVQGSVLGARDFLLSPASLDPRLEGGVPRLLRAASAPPVARGTGPATVEMGESFPLDGSGSTPDEGQTIEWYRWNRLR